MAYFHQYRKKASARILQVIILNGSLMYRTLLTNTRSYRMSERTRAMQRDIAMGLVVQACLPVMYGVSALMFAIGKYNISFLVGIEIIECW